MTTIPEYQTFITVEELAPLLERDDVRIIDCRFDLTDPKAGRRSYLAGHIPGAAFFDLDKDLSASVAPATGRHPMPDAADLAGVFGRAGIDESIQVVLYDDSNGALAARAWWLLRWAGHDRAAVLDGGLSLWKARGMALTSGEERISGRKFSARPQHGRVIEIAEMEALVVSGAEFVLLDARDAVRFRGESEPIDTVAGHIPGAVNLPYTRALHEDGTCRPGAELQALWSATLGDDRRKESIVMCGSGVTACHLVLTALRAGCREPRVYVGSWSEWIRDPERPVAKLASGDAESA